MTMKIWKIFILILANFSLCEYSHQSHITPHMHTDIILIGGMGDLSKKYLLQGFFNLITKHTSEFKSFYLYGSGRTDPGTTKELYFQNIDKFVSCSSKDKQICQEKRDLFYKSTTYIKLKTNEDYKEFCHDLKTKWLNVTQARKTEIEVIVYLSIPSSGYISTAHFINSNCRVAAENWSLKVVMEKPFGNDRSSAVVMSGQLKDILKEEEMYRVDHYLGKTITREILNFRTRNDKLEAMLHQCQVERVEVAMKEHIGVKGRFDFYDQTGVIRDVFQNHLTELLALVAMQLPTNLSSSDDVEREKLKVLRQVKPVRAAGTLVGQYSDYIKEARLEGSDVSVSKFTPTFAATLLEIDSPRWHSVPFLLLGGKMVDQKSSFVRIVFKNNRLCASKCDGIESQQILFNIGHGELEKPAIAVSKSLGRPSWPNAFIEDDGGQGPTELFGQAIKNFHVGYPTVDHDAYTFLIEDVYFGLKDNFIGTEHLLTLWDIWHDITSRDPTVPQIYKPLDPESALAFKLSPGRLEYLQELDKDAEVSDSSEIRQTPSSFLGYKLISSEKNRLAYFIANDIYRAVQVSVSTSSSFHIAFSGGSSPRLLFENLVQHFRDLPWKFVHVWQVDERCLSAQNEELNFYNLDDILLKNVPIPYMNIHPMPVEVSGKLCRPEDNGTERYTELLKQHSGGNNGKSGFTFNYIVLGLGSDGHTASIFPNSSVITETRPVAFTEDEVGSPRVRRMTLTLPVINEADQVSVLVTGKEKQKILKDLENEEGSVMKYPILGVQPASGKLTWYIDDQPLDDRSQMV